MVARPMAQCRFDTSVIPQRSLLLILNGGASAVPPLNLAAHVANWLCHGAA